VKALSGKNILIVSPEAWGTSRLSKHHYAVTLARRGNQVFFLNPPTEKGPRLSVPEKDLTLSVMNYHAGVQGLRHMPSFLRRIFAHWNLRKVESIIQDKIDVVWSFDPSRFISSKSCRNIFHTVDHIEESIFKLAVESTDLVLSVSPELIPSSYIGANNIGHGTTGFKEVEAIDLPGSNKAKALYSGNLLIPYLNRKLMLDLVGENPTVDFIFCGSHSKGNLNPHPDTESEEWIENLKQAPNVHLTGELDIDQLHAHIAAADVLLCAYDHKKYPKRIVNSHKLLEYLASGKTTISSTIPGYPEDLIAFYEDDQGFKDGFRDALTSLHESNDAEIVRKRRDYASEFTYKKQVEKIEGLLSKHE
jgi:glycosyltransferase involved in cell wall biosynthesis